MINKQHVGNYFFNTWSMYHCLSQHRSHGPIFSRNFHCARFEGKSQKYTRKIPFKSVDWGFGSNILRGRATKHPGGGGHQHTILQKFQKKKPTEIKKILVHRWSVPGALH